MAKYLALSGGVGGAKLALGLTQCLPPAALVIVANTGDDFTHLGLQICPDLDTVMYTLADRNNKELGWGQAGESWNFLAALGDLGGETWFSLGDRDLATHIVRTRLLAEGRRLSDVTRYLCERLGIAHPIVPMTDDDVATIVLTPSGERLSFQHYFVRDRCEPRVAGFEFANILAARPSPGFVAALDDVDAVIVCPSNPFVSVDPILALPGVSERIMARGIPVLAVSPIVGGQAIKGPAAKMMDELGMPKTALGVARHYVEKYGKLLGGFMIDDADAALEPAISALGLRTVVTGTVMVTLADRIRLARQAVSLADELAAS